MELQGEGGQEAVEARLVEEADRVVQEAAVQGADDLEPVASFLSLAIIIIVLVL